MSNEITIRKIRTVNEVTIMTGHRIIDGWSVNNQRKRKRSDSSWSIYLDPYTTIRVHTLDRARSIILEIGPKSAELDSSEVIG